MSEKGEAKAVCATGVSERGACTCREPGGMACPVHECLCRECEGHGEVEVATWLDGAPGVDVAPCSRCDGTGQEPRPSQPAPTECRTCRRDSENATECDDCGPENSFAERSPMEPRR